MRQFRYFTRLYDRIHRVDGDVVECGLGEGNTFSMLAYLVGGEERQHARALWGFDSFQGWPEPDPADASPRNPQKGEWKVSEEMIERRFEESGIYKEFPKLDVHVIKGFLSETLPDFPARPIAFLHIDVDLYSGYRDALRYLFPKVARGGLVLFDEYKEFHREDPLYGDKEKWPGCTKAVDEYFKGRQEKLNRCPETKKYYAVKAE